MWKDLVEMRVGFSGFSLFCGIVVMEIQMVGFTVYEALEDELLDLVLNQQPIASATANTSLSKGSTSGG
nr:hypothetical protein CFP56_74114 [Quercus suber]